MPYIAPNGKKYNICLLDTNVLSEIIKNPKIEGKKFLLRYGPKNYVPSWTIYNVIELRRKPELYRSFVDFFSIYPSFILKPYELIFQEELNSFNDKREITALYNAFSPFGRGPNYNLSIFLNEVFENELIKKSERNWRSRENTIIKSWLENKNNFEPSKNMANSFDAEKYVKKAAFNTIMNHDRKKVTKLFEDDHNFNIDQFPSIKVMLYSQYYRLYDPSWRPDPQESTDVQIMGVAPYIDTVITENRQFEILKKIKKRVPGMESLELAKIRNIR